MFHKIQNFFVDNYQQVVGIVTIIFIGFLFSNNRRGIQWKKIGVNLLFLFISAYLFLNVHWIIATLAAVTKFFETLYQIADIGASFVFGPLANIESVGFVFACKVLPVIIFFSAIISVLCHYGIIQMLVRGVGIVLGRLLGTKGPELLCTIGNSFLGQTEAPLLIKSYLGRMNTSEIFIVMVSGMGTMSAGIIAVYGILGISVHHLLIGSILAIPSTLLIAQLFVPNTTPTRWQGKEKERAEVKTGGALGALSKGTQDGLLLALNIGAALIVIISCIHLIDVFLESLSNGINHYFHTHYTISLHTIFGAIAYPFAWMLGIPQQEIIAAAKLLGSKIAINEMIAYSELATLSLSKYTVIVLTYALIGFSNFSSIGIQMGGIGSMEPSIRSIIGAFGVRAVFAAALSSLLTASVVSFFI